MKYSYGFAQSTAADLALMYRYDEDTDSLTMKPAREFCATIASDPRVVAKYGYRMPAFAITRNQTLGAATQQDPLTIFLFKGRATKPVLIHEMAHVYDDRDWDVVDAHDETFCNRFLELVYWFLGWEEVVLISEYYDKFGVAHDIPTDI